TRGVHPQPYLLARYRAFTGAVNEEIVMIGPPGNRPGLPGPPGPVYRRPNGPRAPAGDPPSAQPPPRAAPREASAGSERPEASAAEAAVGRQQLAPSPDP